ncbi:hypothetical protein C2G38_813801 [Gigaspora rosea]|uniref:Uncharacterized protein n=1 Tax=Gigaspora rosea TaxID=44941 RepID=A0A397W994_9GLOM|nr:hypothetical protein C2G38_813801 [Gigaspora rosea]
MLLRSIYTCYIHVTYTFIYFYTPIRIYAFVFLLFFSCTIYLNTTIINPTLRVVWGVHTRLTTQIFFTIIIIKGRYVCSHPPYSYLYTSIYIHMLSLYFYTNMHVCFPSPFFFTILSLRSGMGCTYHFNPYIPVT